MRKKIRNILKGASLTTAMFIFQACYGTGPNMYDQYEVQFKVVSADTGEPLEGIMVNYYDSQITNPMGQTNASGELSFFVSRFKEDETPYTFRIHDPNVVYSSKDTTFAALPSLVEIRLPKLQ